MYFFNWNYIFHKCKEKSKGGGLRIELGIVGYILGEVHVPVKLENLSHGSPHPVVMF